MPLTEEQLALYQTTGHLTVPQVFTGQQMDDAVADACAWGDQVLGRLDKQGKAWYLERGADVAQVLRKLDQPVYHRPVFRQLAFDANLVGLVEQLIGGPVRVHFSQIFLKAPGGGPKPAHQDNFYFGPNHQDGLVTAWIALDDATVANGCLHFVEGSNRGPILEHTAPEDEPFNLQIPTDVLSRFGLQAAPVPRGGVSFHHGNTIHQSHSNNSEHWRRAAAFHYVNTRTHFESPAWDYDESLIVSASD